MRVQLHGGVNRQAAQSVGGGAELEEEEASGGGGRAPTLDRRRRENRIPGESQIYVFPSGSANAAWWHGNQVDNILRLVDRLKRRYNIDESRIYLTGISDGGTGVYYMGMKDPTVWSAFMPLNGSIKVLGNPAVRAEGELYAGNLANRPFYIVNGGRDPLYPVEHVATHVEAFKQLGVPLVFRPQATAGHDTSWWPYERSLFEQFVKQKPRAAAPGTRVVGNRAHRQVQSRRLVDRGRTWPELRRMPASRTRTFSSTGVSPDASTSSAPATRSPRRAEASARSPCCCRRTRSTSLSP